MKRLIISIFAIAILLGISGCGKSQYQIKQEKLAEEQRVLKSKLHKNNLSVNMYIKENQGSFKKAQKIIIQDIENNFAITPNGKVKITNLERQPSEVKLTINAPSGATIKILNIKPKYKDSMWLKTGKYHIKISKSEYITKEQWINLDTSKTLDIQLKKIPIDYFKYVTNIKWDKTTKIAFDIKYDKNINKMIAFIKNIKKMEHDEKARIIDNMKIKIHWKNVQLVNHTSEYSIKETFNDYNKWYNYHIIGQNKWQVPTSDEVQKSNLISDHFTLCRYKKSALNKMKKRGFKPSCNTTKWCYGYFYRGSLQNHARTGTDVYLTRVFNNYDKIIYSKLSASKKLSQLTTLLAQEKLTVIKEKIKKPSKSKQINPKKLKRGEFEKTADYAQRVKKEQKRIDELNKNNIIKYNQQMSDYKVALKKADEKYKKQIAFNKKESTIKKVANDVVGHAITMVFGDPKFKDFKYDADKEQFNATLYSTLNDFTMKVQIPVNIAKAKGFKEKLTDNRIVPSVKLNVSKSKLSFNSVSAVANKIKQKQDFDIAKTKNSIESYNNFLRYHSTAPQAKKAKQLLQIAIEKKAYNKAKYSISKLEAFISKYPKSSFKTKASSKLADLKEKARLKAERERKKRESYSAKKSTGQKVCKEGTVVFFMPVTITAYVENARGDDIQLRISGTEHQKINYQGGKLYVGKVIWGKYWEWGSCEY